MGQFSLTLRVDAPAPGDGAPTMLSKASEELRARLYRSLGLKVHSVAWVTVAPGTAKGDAALRTLIEERIAGRASVGAAILTEAMNRGDPTLSRWFHLDTRTVDDFSLWDDYPSCKAGTLPKLHALNHTFVSSAFVEACRRRGLAGMSFLRCASRGRRPGAPWFVALPDASLGRGLDHPWFDRGKWLRDTGSRPDRRSSAIDVGQWAFHQCWIRDEAAGEPPLDVMLRLCPPPPRFTSGIDGLQVVTIPRHWAAALPQGDFAYVPWGEDGPNVEGKVLRFRKLAVSARAREILLAEGLFNEKSFLPVRIVETPEPHVMVLDRPGDPVPPMYTEAELLVLRAKERLLTARPVFGESRPR
jgi:hypothetical protein